MGAPDCGGHRYGRPLVSAVSAIVALWPQPDIQDSGQITAIDVFVPVPLSEYEHRAPVITSLSIGTPTRVTQP